MHSNFFSSILILLFLLLSACSVGPDYKRAALSIEQEKDFLNIAASEQAEWWTKINDPTLSKWIQTLEDDNYSLQSAMERSIQAEERLNMQNASFRPTLGLNSTANRRRSVSGSFGALGSQIGSAKFYNNSFSLKANTTWQADLFGKLRRGSKLAEASFLATDFDREYLKQSLTIDLIKSRAGIANINKQIKLAKEIISSRKKVSKTVKRRYNSGVANALDLRLAEESYNTARAALPLLKSNLKAMLYSVDVLLGRVPGSTKSELKTLTLLPAPEEIKIPQPVKLIDRRPDLISNELRLYAATQDVGVAIADLYPDLTFSANYGYESLDASEFIQPDQIVWSIAASLTQRLFEGGRLRANIRLKESKARELEASYLQAILNALREVETALVLENGHRKQHQRLSKSVQELREAEKIATNRYSQGLTSIIELLDTQRRRAALEQQYLETEFNIWNARADLYLALGGNWKFNNERNN